MAKAQGKSLKQLAGEATRYAALYFDPIEQVRMLDEAGQPVDGDYAVLVVNRFVPIDWVADCDTMLRRFTRHGGNGLDAAQHEALKDYWRELDAGARHLCDAFEVGEPTQEVAAAARRQPAWPAVGVAASEDDMRELLVRQFETMRHADVLWRCVDSSTYPRPKPNGIYVLVDWFWHGS